MTKTEWLARYDALDEERDVVTRLFREAEETGDYYRADEFAANLNETLAELADYAAELLRGDPLVDAEGRCEHGYFLTGGTGTCPMPREEHEETK